MKLLCTLPFLTTLSLSAAVELPVIFNNHMVLQRDIEFPVWGWANPNEKVTVSFAGKSVSSTADAKGNWSVKLAKHAASAKPQVLKVKGENEIVFKDVLVGDVWICSGQSNMEWPLSKSSKQAKEVAEAHQKNKQLRLFRIPQHLKASEPQKNTVGKWSNCEVSKEVLSFSGCGFFFGSKLEQELDIPIGMIDTSWGGTRIDEWISDSGYEKHLKGAKKQPKRIYNAMVAPLAPFAIKGAIWYQGESNRGDQFPAYFDKTKALIDGWREEFQVGDFPFYMVQIAPFKYNRKKPGDDTILCKNIWASQYKAAKEIKNCGVVPIHDTIHGVITNIHPWDKKPVAERLANLALKNQYGKNLTVTGPTFGSAKLSSGKIIVSFDSIDKGLTTTDKENPTGFEVAGKDQVFVPADAKIKGKTVEVSSDKVKSINYVRMGWQEVLVPNLSDKNGWPAFQFGVQKVK